MKSLLILLLFFCLTIIVTWPLVLNLNHLIIDPHDGLLITWFLNWDIHALSGIGNFFNANIFFPYHSTLAFSEIMLPEALLAAPLVLFFREPLLAYNLNFFLGFALTGYSIFLLAKFLTKDEEVSLLAGIIFTFSTIHMSYMAHIQLFNFWPVVFALLFLFQKKYKLYVFFFVIASLTTALFLYFLLAILCIRLVFNFSPRDLKATFLASLLTAPFLVPYFLVSRQFSYVRPITDAINFSLQFPDLANIGAASRLTNFIPQLSNSTPAYLGAVFLLLVFLMLVGKRKTGENFWLVTALASLILALGPALHIFRNTVHIWFLPGIPLPYSVLYFLVPGFSGFRTPSRWIILTAFSLVMALAIHFSGRVAKRAAVVLALFVIFEVNFPFQFTNVPSRSEFPPEQAWLMENYKNAPIIQFPIYNWDDKEFGQETLREYYSTIHWHPMFNGYSGFSPKEWESRVKWLQKNFPNQESIAFLQSINIRLVLVPREWETRFQSFSKLRLIQKFPDVAVYELSN